jgi:hypothetical protein
MLEGRLFFGFYRQATGLRKATLKTEERVGHRLSHLILVLSLYYNKLSTKPTKSNTLLSEAFQLTGSKTPCAMTKLFS